jgi:RimJ/RimL family protein N-acetyltransferase
MAMENWIKYPTTLSGQFVDLISLEKEHYSALQDMAKDRRIWEFYTLDCSDPVIFWTTLVTAISEREKGNQFPFTIFHKKDNKIIGSTRFLDIQCQHKKLEIGWTWIHPDYWSTGVNEETKLLLLTFCFEQLQTVRVQLKTDENNWRSRKAIEKIGGQFEGILRNDMIRDNQTRRNSAYYSIIEEEWKDKKFKLTELFLAKKMTLI